LDPAWDNILAPSVEQNIHKLDENTGYLQG